MAEMRKTRQIHGGLRSLLGHMLPKAEGRPRLEAGGVVSEGVGEEAMA